MKTEKERLMDAEAYCSAAEHCRSEVAAKLRSHRQDESCGNEEAGVVDRILTHLEEEGYIDENRYAAAFVHDKLHFARWGRVKICSELRRKGVPQSCIEAAVEAIDEEEYLEILRGVINSKRSQVKGSTTYECSMKLLRFAAQRGFEPSLAARIINIPEEN